MCSTHSSCSSAQFVEKKTEWKTDAFLTFIFSTQAWVSFNPFYGKSKIMKEVGVGKWWCGARLVILNLVPTGHQQKACTRHGTNTNSTDPGAVMPSNGFRLQSEPFSMRGLFMQMFFSMSNTPKKTTVISWTNFLHTHMLHQKQVYNFPLHVQLFEHLWPASSSAVLHHGPQSCPKTHSVSHWLNMFMLWIITGLELM